MLFFTCVIGICSSAVIKNSSPGVENAPEKAIEEVNENQASELETAESKHFGFGPRVVVINKGHGGYGGYGGYSGGVGCGCGNSHYHYHKKFYGKK